MAFLTSHCRPARFGSRGESLSVLSSIFTRVPSIVANLLSTLIRRPACSVSSLIAAVSSPTCEDRPPILRSIDALKPWHYPKERIKQVGTLNLPPKDTPRPTRHNLHTTKCCSKTAPLVTRIIQVLSFHCSLELT